MCSRRATPLLQTGSIFAAEDVPHQTRKRSLLTNGWAAELGVHKAMRGNVQNHTASVQGLHTKTLNGVTHAAATTTEWTPKRDSEAGAEVRERNRGRACVVSGRILSRSWGRDIEASAGGVRVGGQRELGEQLLLSMGEVQRQGIVREVQAVQRRGVKVSVASLVPEEAGGASHSVY